MNLPRILTLAYRSRMKTKNWHRIVRAMAMVVVFCTTYTLILPAITMESGTVCGITAHSHTEQCYETATVLHSHDESCYNKTAICGIEEHPAHSHLAECTGFVPTLICELPEEDHRHNAACYSYEQGLVCELEESEGHTHSEACWQTDLICGLSEAQEVTVTNLICGMEEHVHVESCYPAPTETTAGETLPAMGNPNADVETESDWLESFASVELTEDWSENLLSLANSQLGYAESKFNLSHDQQGNIYGYTRYGAWYGQPYGPWDAKFIAFCLHYAGVEGIPYDADTAQWLETLTEEGLYQAKADHQPNPGDLVFLDRDYDEKADHAAILYQIQPETGILELIAGDWNHRVDRVEADEAAIMGYVPLPQEPSEEENGSEHYVSVSEDGITAEVQLNTALPAGAELTVTPIGADSEGYAVMAAQIEEALSENIEKLTLLDLSFMVDGEYHSVSDNATVTLCFDGDIFAGRQVKVFHFTENGPTELNSTATTFSTFSLRDEAIQTQLTFETEGFSVFAVVEFTTNGSRYEMVNLTDLSQLDGNSFHIICSHKKNGMTATEPSTSLVGKCEVTINTTSINLDGSSLWTFEKQTDGKYKIHSNGQYLKMERLSYKDASLQFADSVENATNFTVQTNNNGQLTISYTDSTSTTYYINEHAGDGGTGFGGWYQNDNGSKLYLYRDVVQTTPVTGLEGNTYAIVSGVGVNDKAITAQSTTVNNHFGLASQQVDIVTINGTDYVITPDVTKWTFEKTNAEGVYNIYTEVNGTRQYLHLLDSGYGDGRGSLTLENRPQDITVTANADGTVYLSATKGTHTGYINLDQSGSGNFWVYNAVVDSNKLRLCIETESADTYEEYTILYDLDLDTSVNDLIDKIPTVNNQRPYTENILLGNDHAVLDPHPKFYTSIFNQKSNKIYRFLHWLLPDGTALYPGDTLTAEQIIAQSINGILQLTAKWDEYTTTEQVVNFFVNKVCQPIDFAGESDISSGTGLNDFTASIWVTSTNLNGRTFLSHWQSRDSNNFILSATDRSEAQAVDAAIRSMAKGGYDTNSDLSYGGWRDNYTGETNMTLDTFPSDEIVLQEVRNWLNESNNNKVELGNTIFSKANNNVDLINARYFTIRWNKVLYDVGDGWHVDGVLVAKQSKTVIKKTFEGDADAIASVKNNFSLSVKNRDTTAADANLTLTLNPESEERELTTIGYTSYDETSNTYTWLVPGLQNNTYTVTENNYDAKPNGDVSYISDPDYTHTNITNPVKDWTTYPTTGITYTGLAYLDTVGPDAYQTIAFRNIYTKAGTLIIQKVDGTTGRGIPDISFTLGIPDGEELRYSAAQSLYSTDSTDWEVPGNDFVTVPDCRIVTNANGIIMIKMESPGAGNTVDYTLQESIPTGYGGISELKVTVRANSDNNLEFDQVVSTDTSVETETYVDKTSAMLTIRNISVNLISLKAQKIWTETETPEEVQVELWCNGAKAQDTIFTQTLNEGNNWSWEWNQMPLYLDGKPAVYTLRETKIGNTSYDDTGTYLDGYQHYTVSFDNLVYLDDNEKVVPGAAYEITDEHGNTITDHPTHGLLTVRNKPYTGEIILLKVDEKGNDLAGATFGLYKEQDCTTLLSQDTSNENGQVIFTRQPIGTYYIKEIAPPVGYTGIDTVYTATVSATGVTITDPEGRIITTVQNNPITVDLTIQKLSDMTAPLSGAGFTITGTSRKDAMVDNDGKLEIKGLRAGTYVITETVVPPGYIGLSGPITIIVNNDGSITDATGDKVGHELEGTTLKISNHSGYELPSTGSLGVGWIYILGLGLMGAALWLHRLDVIKKRQGGMDIS